MRFSRRNDESDNFYKLRISVNILLIFGYFLYLSYLIWNNINDRPILKIERSFLDEIEVPGKFN